MTRFFIGWVAIIESLTVHGFELIFQNVFMAIFSASGYDVVSRF